MKTRLYIAASLIVFHLAVTSAAFGQPLIQHSHMHGKVEFPNSCSSTVQAKLLDGIAMLHSFFYSGAQQAFEEVAREDQSCTIATWGYASILMLNPLQGVGASPENARLAQAAIDKARSVGAKTQRERDYLEAVAAYYEDFPKPSRAGAPYRVLGVGCRMSLECDQVRGAHDSIKRGVERSGTPGTWRKEINKPAKRAIAHAKNLQRQEW